MSLIWAKFGYLQSQSFSLDPRIETNHTKHHDQKSEFLPEEGEAYRGTPYRILCNGTEQKSLEPDLDWF